MRENRFFGIITLVVVFCVFLGSGTKIFAADFAGEKCVHQCANSNLELNINGQKITLTVSVDGQKESLPFYFPPGVMMENTNQAKQYKELLDHMAATWKKFQEGGFRRFIVGNSIAIQTDVLSTCRSDREQNMILVLDNFVLLPDGRVRVTFFGEQHIITTEQLRLVVADLLAVVNEASEANCQYYKDRVERIITARAKTLVLSREEFVACLDKQVDGSSVTFRQVNSVPPEGRKSDFVPNELHLGMLPDGEGVLGATWKNSGLIYYNPQARILDYITGQPRVMQHEMMHVNTHFQNFPLAEGFDVELLAMIPDGVLPKSQIDLFFHHYMEEMRTLAWIYFGFDFSEAQKKFVEYDASGNWFINEEKFNGYCVQIKQIAAEYHGFFQTVVIPELYSDPIFWNAFNEKMQNPNAYLWVLMRKHYEPTILGGHRETRIWLDAHQFEIEQMAKEAFKKSNSKQDNDSGAPSFLVNKYRSLFNERERKAIENHFRNHPEELESLKKMSFGEAAKLLDKISKERGL